MVGDCSRQLQHHRTTQSQARWCLSRRLPSISPRAEIILATRGSSKDNVGNRLHPHRSASRHMRENVFLRPEAVEEAQAAPPPRPGSGQQGRPSTPPPPQGLALSGSCHSFHLPFSFTAQLSYVHNLIIQEYPCSFFTFNSIS